MSETTRQSDPPPQVLGVPRGFGGALGVWAPLLLASFLVGCALSALAQASGLPLDDGLAGLAVTGLAIWSVCAAGYLIWLPLAWLRPGTSRRAVVRSIAAPLGWSLLVLWPLMSPMGYGKTAAAALAAGAAVTAAWLGRRVGWSKLLVAVLTALVLSASIMDLPKALMDRLGPWVASPALAAALAASAILLALAGRPLKRFPERIGPALMAVSLPLATGAVYYGLLYPTWLYRSQCLSPQAILGVDHQGGCYLRSRTGEVFHGAASRPTDLRRVGLPKKARLGRIRTASGRAVALEMTPQGDRLWFLMPQPARRVDIGRPTGEAMFVADFDLDGDSVVAVDALGDRVAWINGEGRIVRTDFPPVEAGAPHLVSMSSGTLHLYADSGAILRRRPQEDWTVLKTDPVYGKPLDFACSDRGCRLQVRTGLGRSKLYRLDETAAGAPRWVAAAQGGPVHKLAFDKKGRIFRLQDARVQVTWEEPRGGPPPPRGWIGPPDAALRAFLRSPAGRLIRLMEGG